jgi:hypothetical protein
MAGYRQAVSGLAIGWALAVTGPICAERELSTDRPDTTESPYTVDRGFYQLELEPVSWSENDDDRAYVASANLKYGLSDAMDLQLVLEYDDVDSQVGDSANGIGDTELRLKINMWGNDDGDTAFALMPFVRFPTHDDELGEGGDVEGGLIAPLGFALPNGWSSAVMIEVDVVRNAADDGYVPAYVLSATIAHDIAGDWGGFLELVSISLDEDGAESEAYFNSGITRAIGDRMQFDCGFNLGLTGSSEDRRLFVGFSMKGPIGR